MSWKVLITARTVPEVGKKAVALLKEAGCDVFMPPKLGPLPASDLLPLLNGADAVLCSPDDYSATVLNAPEAARLKIISRSGVGYDSIDWQEATHLGIAVAYTPGFLNEAVADYAFALLLTVARQVHAGHLAMTQGIWASVWGHDVSGKTLGILGCGRIGQAMARRAAGFNMRVIGYDVNPCPEAEKIGIKMVSLDELLAESDFLSLHAALTPQNRGLIGARQLGQMKRHAYLINTARGALIDEAALADALRKGVIAGAALDTFSVEPLPQNHLFRDVPNLLLTPHQAAFAYETGEQVSMAAAEAIVRLMGGTQPQFVVNPNVFSATNLRAKLK